MYDITSGEYVRGFLSSSDLTTAAAIPLFSANGTSRSLVAGERLVVGSMLVANGATASVITVFSDADADGVVDTGEALFAASLTANQVTSPSLIVPLVGIRSTSAGIGVSAIATAASVSTRITLAGWIIKS